MGTVIIFPNQLPQTSVPDVRGMGWVARRAAMLRAAFHLEKQEKALRIVAMQTFDGDERAKLQAQLRQVQADIRSIRAYARAGFPAIREI